MVLRIQQVCGQNVVEKSAMQSNQNGRRYRQSGAGGHMGATHPLNLMGRNHTRSWLTMLVGQVIQVVDVMNGMVVQHLCPGIPRIRCNTHVMELEIHAHRGGHGMIRIRFIADVDADPTYPEYPIGDKYYYGNT